MQTKSHGYTKIHRGCGGEVYFVENVGGGSPDFFLVCARCDRNLYIEEVKCTLKDITGTIVEAGL